MFEQVLYLVSRLHMGENVIGQLMGIRAQLMAQIDANSYVIINFIDSVINSFK